jgi:hypothetical protein
VVVGWSLLRRRDRTDRGAGRDPDGVCDHMQDPLVVGDRREICEEDAVRELVQ